MQNSTSKIGKLFILCMGALVLLIAVLPWIYSLLGPTLDRMAMEETEEICGQIEIGAPATTLGPIAKRNEVTLLEWKSKGESVRYQISTAGYLTNSATCDIRTDKGMVVSKNVEVNKW